MIAICLVRPWNLKLAFVADIPFGRWHPIWSLNIFQFSQVNSQSLTVKVPTLFNAVNGLKIQFSWWNRSFLPPNPHLRGAITIFLVGISIFLVAKSKFFVVKLPTARGVREPWTAFAARGKWSPWAVQSPGRRADQARKMVESWGISASTRGKWWLNGGFMVILCGDFSCGYFIWCFGIWG